MSILSIRGMGIDRHIIVAFWEDSTAPISYLLRVSRWVLVVNWYRLGMVFLLESCRPDDKSFLSVRDGAAWLELAFKGRTLYKWKWFSSSFQKKENSTRLSLQERAYASMSRCSIFFDDWRLDWYEVKPTLGRKRIELSVHIHAYPACSETYPRLPIGIFPLT